MSEPIFKKTAIIWNKRFAAKMKELGLTQRKFIKRYNDCFHTGSQSDASNWMNVGSIDGKTGKPRQFPEFKTMQQIAAILGVSVSYLIGESDYESFEEEQVANYLGLSAQALRSIRGITYGKVIPPFFKYPDMQVTSALDAFLSSNSLVKYLKNIYTLKEAYAAIQNPKSHFDEAVKNIPAKMQDDAVSLWSDSEKAVEEEGISPTDELWSYVKLLDNAAQEDMAYSDNPDQEIKAIRYALQEINSHLIDETCNIIRLDE